MESNNLIKRMIKQEKNYILFDTEGKVENNTHQKFLDRMNKEPKVKQPTLSRTSIYLSQPKKNNVYNETKKVTKFL